MKKLLLLTGLVLALGGCGLGAMAVEGFSQVGATESARKRLLQKDMKRFHSGLYWGKPGVVVQYVVPEMEDVFKAEMRESKRKERIVEHQVELVDFSDDAYEATVEVLVKYYEVPYYMVKDRLEREQWQFSMGQGWKISSRERLPMS